MTGEADPRDAVVGGILRDVADAMSRSKAVYGPLTEGEEQLVNALIVQALGPPVLDGESLTYRQFWSIWVKGKAAKAICDVWPDWGAWPDTPLSDRLKVASEDQLDRVYASLRRLGRG
jgi:hypothetical protein